jgi:hypothetical protein
MYTEIFHNSVADFGREPQKRRGGSETGCQGVCRVQVRFSSLLVAKLFLIFVGI